MRCRADSVSLLLDFSIEIICLGPRRFVLARETSLDGGFLEFVSTEFTTRSEIKAHCVEGYEQILKGLHPHIDFTNSVDLCAD